MKDEYNNRLSWGAPIPIDTTLLIAADDVYPHSSILDNDEINIAWSKDWDDRDYLSAEWFALNYTERNHRANFNSGDNEFIPIHNSFYADCKPTIGEMAYVSVRFTWALFNIRLLYDSVMLSSFPVTLEKARRLFPEYEGLAWALLHGEISKDTTASTFDEGIGSLHDSGIDFDTVVNFVNHGILLSENMRKAFEHDIDPRLLTGAN